MKTDRLVGILTYLLQTDRATMPELAARFEVSRRTIQRDVDALCRAGIPLVSTRGSGGGVAIMDGYKLDRRLLSPGELQGILAGLRGLDSVSKTSSAEQFLQKVSARGEAPLSPDGDLVIDLASFYKDSLSEKIELLRRAIAQRELVCFHYYYGKGEADKRVEPYSLVFKWSDWYLFGFCTQRQDFRLYKLGRLWALTPAGEGFVPRPVPAEKRRFGSQMRDDYLVTALYCPAAKYRLVEERGPDSFSVAEDGRLLARWGFAGPEEALAWFLSFGDGAEVINPPQMRERVREEAEKIAARHR
ncbi:helix-turn-helix transcriptional regulator [Bittarella massiliensis (ex Durand et al. 2017)]|uniref:YafY family transcriptional regulator n=1 Tax=Bittarella massiliensis (ex Durand et al. 2017) TaxID=1720313 RepID=A0AAW5KFL8_9FIRM|nr:YafY family transcriptional regulator [Bittarella massiliensis (ex Durand et al. 2017)]